MWVVYNPDSMAIVSRHNLKPQAKAQVKKYRVTSINSYGERVRVSGSHLVGIMHESKYKTFMILRNK